jgi:CubicO group peptidase (beta-lactamase class C family)
VTAVRGDGGLAARIEELLGSRHSVAAAALISSGGVTVAGRGADLDADFEIGPNALIGRSRRGRPRQPWTGEAVGPAGGIRASIQDMARLVAALLDGSAPGITALDPIAPFGKGARIGAGWITIAVEGRQIAWHNGGTGGFRSWVGLDRDTGTGAVVLSATSASVDRYGFLMLTEHTRTVINS